MICSFFLPFYRLLFQFVDGFLCCAEAASQFDEVPLIFAFIAFGFGVKSKKLSPRPMSRSLLPMFSFRNFMVSGLTLTSLIHFEFIFVSGVRWCSNLIVLYVAVQFSQHHLLKTLSSLYCIFFLLCYRLINHRCMGLFLGSLFCSIDLCVCSCASTVLFWLLYLCIIVWKLGGWYFQLCSFSQDCYGNLGSFVVPHEF